VRPPITIAVEGITDAVVLKRTVNEAGLTVVTEYIMRGKGKLDAKLKAYNAAAKFAHWLVLRDLNSDALCAPTLVANLLPAPAPSMRLHIAVRETEAWLLADVDEIARFLSISRDQIPSDPDGLSKPKASLIDLAMRSKSRAIRDAIVPVQGMTARVGPGYSSVIAQFAGEKWRPRVAAKKSPSLGRLMRYLDGLVA